MADYLLHSVSSFSEIIEKVLIRVSPKVVLEIGFEGGGSSKQLAKYAYDTDSQLLIVDPAPREDPLEVLAEFSNNFSFHRDLSVNVLVDKKADLYLIDGDHNYWTVKNELNQIFQANPHAWVMLHDVGFPWGRRDMYYNPGALPPEYVHEYTYVDGVDSNGGLVEKGGFRGCGEYAISKKSGGLKNGVLTAVEDFMKGKDFLFFDYIEPVFGFGVICPFDEKDFLLKVLFPYKNQLIRNMEKNRLELYLRVIELQDELNGSWLRRLKASVFKVMKSFRK